MDTPATVHDINKIVRILMDASHTKKLNFKVYNLAITPDKFRRVAMAIKQGKIKVVYESKRKYASGAYNNISNTLSFNKRIVNLNNIVGQSFIIHEAVHASNDIDKSGYIDVVDDETAAYISQCIYFLETPHSYKYKLSFWNMKSDQKYFQKVLYAARDAAWHIISGKRSRNGETPLTDAITVIQYNLKRSKMYCRRVNRTQHYTGV